MYRYVANFKHKFNLPVSSKFLFQKFLFAFYPLIRIRFELMRIKDPELPYNKCGSATLITITIIY